MIKKIILAIVLMLVVAGGVLFAINGKDTYEADKFSAKVSDGLNIGSEISFTIPDQFDKPHSLTRDTKILILAFAKDTGHTVKHFLSQKDKNYLPSKNALFIADISPMPTVIRNTFALPDLKKSAYSVLLIYDKNIASKLKNEAQADKIAVVSLDNSIVKNVVYITNEDELTEALN